MRGDEPMPDPGTMEARNLARLASQARWGKADPRFEAAFAQYFYHKREQVNPDEEEETREDEDGEEEE